MNFRFFSLLLSLLVIAGFVAFGVAVGYVGVFAAGLEARWLVYIGGAVIFIPFFLMLPNQEGFLWGLFIVCLQAPIAIYLLYGYGGGDGIAIFLPSIIGVGLLGWYVVTGRIVELFPLNLGGPMLPALIALSVTTFVSLVWTTEKFTGVATLIWHGQLYLYFWLAANRVKTPRQLEQTLHLLFSVLLTQSIIYCMESTLGITFDLVGNSHDSTGEGGVIRPGGTVSHGPHGFAGFILPILLVLISKFVLKDGEGSRRWIYGGIILMGSIAMALTVTRAYYVAYLIGMIVIFTLAYRRGYLAMKTIVVSSISFLGAFALFAVPLLLTRLEVVSTAASYDERYALMRLAVNVIQGNPIFGVGPGAYNFFFKDYLTPDLEGKWLWTVHNNYLLRAAETGIPGLLAFIWMLLRALSQGLRATHSKNLIVLALAFGFSATIPEYCWNMWWEMGTFFAAQGIFWILMGLMVAADAMEKAQTQAVPIIPKPSGKPVKSMGLQGGLPARR